ncbi:3870_t:CDS:1 [Paraglomus brasilianum]|uniref:3870_t:CDS:1 n=1 Tax=Paraglomus brasilianum TaxID=144538 RepID=A0A9N9G795_9GLOM|nr:3870_t:CDS:1 [Paraglomus brasilianum]
MSFLDLTSSRKPFHFFALISNIRILPPHHERAGRPTTSSSSGKPACKFKARDSPLPPKFPRRLWIHKSSLASKQAFRTNRLLWAYVSDIAAHGIQKSEGLTTEEAFRCWMNIG